MKKITVTVMEFIAGYVSPFKGYFDVLDAKCSINGLSIITQLTNDALGLRHFIIAPTLDAELESRAWEFGHYADEIFECKMHYTNKYLLKNSTKW